MNQYRHLTRARRGLAARMAALLMALMCATAPPAHADAPESTAQALPDLRPDLDLSQSADGGAQPDEAAGQHRIYASLPPVYALLEQLTRGMEEFEPLQLVQPQLDCVRLYELSDWDYVQLTGAEVCVIWGQGLESFAGTLTSAESGPAVIALADAPDELPALADGLSDVDYHAHFSGQNPNSYLSIERVSAALNALYESLCELYPAHAGQFELNYRDARATIDAALDELDELRASASGGICAALYEGAPYALDELGIEWTCAYPREPASAVTGADLDELMSRMAESGARVAVLERQAPGALVDALTEAGYEVRLMSTLMTLDKPTLDELMDALMQNARALIAA